MSWLMWSLVIFSLYKRFLRYLGNILKVGSLDGWEPGCGHISLDPPHFSGLPILNIELSIEYRVSLLLQHSSGDRAVGPPLGGPIVIETLS